jgi:hypothetical protein
LLSFSLGLENRSSEADAIGDEYVESELKKEANRKNAALSTGPRNTKTTRFNALKHGLLSKELIVPNVEDRKEYERMAARICRTLAPEDAIEEVLAERIIVAYWRLRRAIRAETGHIRRNYIPKDPPNRLLEIMDRDQNSFETDSDSLAKKNNVKLRDEAEAHCNNIPMIEPMDGLLRYETTIERQFYRALREFQNYRQTKLNFSERSQSMSDEPSTFDKMIADAIQTVKERHESSGPSKES